MIPGTHVLTKQEIIDLYKYLFDEDISYLKTKEELGKELSRKIMKENERC